MTPEKSEAFNRAEKQRLFNRLALAFIQHGFAAYGENGVRDRDYINWDKAEQLYTAVISLASERERLPDEYEMVIKLDPAHWQGLYGRSGMRPYMKQELRNDGGGFDFILSLPKDSDGGFRVVATGQPNDEGGTGAAGFLSIFKDNTLIGHVLPEKIVGVSIGEVNQAPEWLKSFKQAGL